MVWWFQLVSGPLTNKLQKFEHSIVQSHKQGLFNCITFHSFSKICIFSTQRKCKASDSNDRLYIHKHIHANNTCLDELKNYSCKFTQTRRFLGCASILKLKTFKNNSLNSKTFVSCINSSKDGCDDRWGRYYSTLSDRAVDEPCKTSLYDFHVKCSGKMVPFAGFLLPVSYGGESIAASHLHTRKHCSVFDVSHMLQTEIRGKDRLEFLESLCTADLQNLEDNKSVLTVFTDSITGGILDDLVVTKTALGYLHVVSNASRRYQDQLLMIKAQDAWRSLGKDVQCQFLTPEERALLAVQGPDAAQVLNSLVDVDLEQLPFMTSTLATVGDVPRCRITRCGYTGEDGVEISVSGDKAEHLAGLLLQSSNVKMAGLGARDTLRLEAGMCLHGSDIDHTTTPVEAGLSFVIAKRRRESADFPGSKVILHQLKNGPSRCRVGLRASPGPPVRAGARILTAEGDDVVG
uniref:Aminomethyltransferase n=1 Tax=Timema bartmani TaxID=61472 RepID=A0A7R9HYG4_9NEOP|nr:unnamed protein product [Timema bartmani]